MELDPKILLMKTLPYLEAMVVGAKQADEPEMVDQIEILIDDICTCAKIRRMTEEEIAAKGGE